MHEHRRDAAGRRSGAGRTRVLGPGRVVAAGLAWLVLAPLALGQGVYPNGAVAADHPLASEAGAQMLRQGGNAVDAAVAVSFTLSVVRPDSCGIGGGGFMLVVEPPGPDGAPGPATFLDYRETCPGGVGPGTFEEARDPEASTFTGLAVGVPGTVAGLLHALERWGTLPREVVMAPAIRAAEEGYAADAHAVRVARELGAWFEARPSRAERFPLVWDRLCRRGRLREGDLIVLPEQAAALRLIARDGADAFYRGPIARSIVGSAERAGGVLTLDDLAAYRPVERRPLRRTITGRDGSRLELLTAPPPSSGGVALAQAFTLLDLHGPGEPRAHALVEAMKHAFADRAAWMGDPGFVDVPVGTLLSDDYLRQRAGVFDPASTHPPEAYGTRPGDAPAEPAPEDHGTSHYGVVDARGMGVAGTETINLAFGSRVGVEDFGFVLNNQMDDFTSVRGAANAFGLVQSDRNRPEPGKRPLSSMTPSAVRDERGGLVALGGGSGGPRIISATLQVLVAMLRDGRSPADAVAAPRLHHQWSPDVVLLEPALAGGEVERALVGRGHTVRVSDEPLGCVQAIGRVEGGWAPASDPRKGGAPAGH